MLESVWNGGCSIPAQPFGRVQWRQGSVGVWGPVQLETFKGPRFVECDYPIVLPH